VKALLLSLLACLPLAAPASAQPAAPQPAAPQPAAPQLKGGVFDPPRPAPEIALPASTGKPFRLSEQRGKVVVLEFGFTHCPAVCPVSLASLTEARRLLGPRAKDVQVLFVTVDPARDSADHLRDYLARFDPTFIGITGSEAQIAQLLKTYGISATKIPIAGTREYNMNHSSYLYFIDREGRQRSMLPFGRPAADIAHDLAILLGR
jgi:protein SCO1/2